MNILLNIYNFHEDYARKTLEPYITMKDKVLIIPFSHHEDWIRSSEEWENEFGKEGRMYDELIQPFLSYGVKEKNVKWIDEYEDNRSTTLNKVNWSTIIYMPGGYPEKIMKRVDAFGIREKLKEYKGIFMGSSAGAMVQFKEYHMTPDRDYDAFGYYEGLGRIDDFEIEVHYENTLVQRKSMRRFFEDKRKRIYAIEDDGGLLVKDDGSVIPFGDVHLYRNRRELENIPTLDGENFYYREMNYDDEKRILEEDRDLPSFLKLLTLKENDCLALIRKDTLEVCGYVNQIPGECGILHLKIRFYDSSDLRIIIGGKTLIKSIIENTDSHRVECSLYEDGSIEGEFLYRTGFHQEAQFQKRYFWEGQYFTEFVYSYKLSEEDN